MSSIELAYWLMIVGALLVVVGVVGFLPARSRRNRSPQRSASKTTSCSSTNLDLGDSVGVVIAWEPPSLKLEMNPSHVTALEAAMAQRDSWRSAAQSSGRVDWIGNAVAEAFEIDRSDVNWKHRVKRIIKSLQRQDILTPSEALSDHRKPVPTFVFNPPKNHSDNSE